MKNPSFSLLSALCVLGCGNYSNDDVEFLNALPHASDLTVKVPQTQLAQQGLGGADGGAAPSCGDGLGQTSCYFIDTVGESGTLNHGLELLLGVLDAIESYPPSSRTAGSRTWGPVADGAHPGFEAQVVISRSDPTHYQWAFDYRPIGSPPSTTWFAFVSGQFVSTTGPRRGIGSMTVDGQGATAIGLQTGNLGTATISAQYATDKNPISIHFAATANDGNPLDTISYDALEYVDSSWFPDGGALRFVQPTQTDAGEVQLLLKTTWALSGLGRGDAQILSPPSMVGISYIQCWGNAPAFAIDYAQLASDAGTLDAGDPSACLAPAPL